MDDPRTMTNDNVTGSTPVSVKKSKPKAASVRKKQLEKRYSCSICSKNFTFVSNLHRHMKNIHKRVEKCLVEGCDHECSNKRKMLLHLELVHGPNIEKEDLDFVSLEEFYAWKLREEVQNFVCFTKRRGDTEMRASIHQNYICYLSRRVAAKEKLEKLDLFCPARIIVKRSRECGTVHATYFKTHSHALTYSGSQLLPMPECVRHEIKEKLKTGSTINQVYSQLKRDHQSQLAVSIAMYNRLRKVTKTQILMIQRAMIKTGALNDKAIEEEKEDDLTENAYGVVDDEEVVQNLGLQMEVETDKNFAKDLLLSTSQGNMPPEVVEHGGGDVTPQVDCAENQQTTQRLQDMLKQLMVLLENRTVKKTMLPCIEGSVDELISLCKVEMR